MATENRSSDPPNTNPRKRFRRLIVGSIVLIALSVCIGFFSSHDRTGPPTELAYLNAFKPRISTAEEPQMGEMHRVWIYTFRGDPSAITAAINAHALALGAWKISPGGTISIGSRTADRSMLLEMTWPPGSREANVTMRYTPLKLSWFEKLMRRVRSWF